MNTLIKTIEDLSLNAWPSHQIELYDGWILRFSYFYTHRTNSVEQIGPSTIPVEEKVQYCDFDEACGNRPTAEEKAANGETAEQPKKKKGFMDKVKEAFEDIDK